MAVEWSLVLFSLLAGTGGGAFVLIAVSELLGVAEKPRFTVGVVATALVVVGGFCSVVHLERPDRIMWAAQNIFSFSGISVELIFVGIVVLLAIMYLILCKRDGMDAARKAVAVLALIAGVLLAFCTGHGYVLEARANWNTLALPLAYMGTALASGGFLFLAIAASMKVEESEFQQMARFGLILSVLSAFLLAAYVIVVGIEAASVNALVLWGGVVLCGIAGTIGAAGAAFAKPSMAMAASGVGLACALAGGLALRVLMWLIGTGLYSLFDTAANVRILM